MTRKLAFVPLASLVMVAAMLTGAGSASASAGCSTPISTRPLDSGQTFLKGKGTFTCNTVNSVSTNVQLYYKLVGTQDYRLVDSTGWISKGNLGASRTWSSTTSWTEARCGYWMVRSWVRWKYRGSASYTSRDKISTWTPCH
jgi:hypothetical protein